MHHNASIYGRAAHVWYLFFLAAALETPCDPMPLEAEGLYFWVPWAYKIRQIARSWLPLPTTAQTTDWNTPCLCEKVVCLYSSLGLKADLWSSVLSENGGSGCSICALTMSCCSSFRRKIIHTSGVLIWWLSPKGHLHISCGGQEGLYLYSHKIVYICIL